MKNTLVIVADLASLKAYQLRETHLGTPRLELIEDYRNGLATERVLDRVSDFSGSFPRGAGAGLSAGERHNANLELRKRLIRELGQRLNRLAGDPKIERCFLAASREILNPLINELEAQVRAKITKNLPADLTKLKPAAILSRFAPPMAAAGTRPALRAP